MSFFIHGEDIHKVYYLDGGAKVTALRGLSLEVEKGEFLVIMGPSGSGKSTFMNLIGCLDTSINGKLFLEDAELSLLNQNQLATIRNNFL